MGNEAGVINDGAAGMILEQERQINVRIDQNEENNWITKIKEHKEGASEWLVSIRILGAIPK